MSTIGRGIEEVELILGNQSEFMKYLKSKFPMIHMSNVFFRDFHYGRDVVPRRKGDQTQVVRRRKIARKLGPTSNEKVFLKKSIINRGSLTIPNCSSAHREKSRSGGVMIGTNDGNEPNNPASPSSPSSIETLATTEYKYGFETAVEIDSVRRGSTRI